MSDLAPERLAEIREHYPHAANLYGRMAIRDLLAHIGQLTAERDAAVAEVEHLRTGLFFRGFCGAQAAEQPTWIPCMLVKGHEGEHWSTSGCAGGQVRWPAGSTTPDPSVSDLRP